MYRDLEMQTRLKEILTQGPLTDPFVEPSAASYRLSLVDGVCSVVVEMVQL